MENRFVFVPSGPDRVFDKESGTFFVQEKGAREACDILLEKAAEYSDHGKHFLTSNKIRKLKSSCQDEEIYCRGIRAKDF
jgi:hypothetical protein